MPVQAYYFCYLYLFRTVQLINHDIVSCAGAGTAHSSGGCVPNGADQTAAPLRAALGKSYHNTMLKLTFNFLNQNN